MSAVVWASVFISAANAGVLAYLLFEYVRVYRSLHAPFTLGLIIFASILLFQSILSIAAGLWLGLVSDITLPIPGSPLEAAPDLLWLLLLPGVFQLVALAVLLRITRQ